MRWVYLEMALSDGSKLSLKLKLKLKLKRQKPRAH